MNSNSGGSVPKKVGRKNANQHGSWADLHRAVDAAITRMGIKAPVRMRDFHSKKTKPKPKKTT